MATPQRPLSPHLQVYRWQIQMATSILHRATGVILAAGALLITAGLVALMIGPDAWNCVTRLAGAWYGQLFLFGWTWAFAYHLCNGIRHIVQDFAIGYRISTFVRSSWLSVIGSLVITALVWAYVWLGGGA
jgi:succinate dehydrogenase / fumarate reductase cytochrome b subunit